MARSLSLKQRLFVEAYLRTRNATQAAREAGYQGNDNVLAVKGHENLRKPEIAALISARIAEQAMLADEVLARLAEQARADISEFIKLEKGYPVLDLEKAERAGKLHLVKSLVPTRYGTKLELYDAQAALQLLGKAHGLFTERFDMTTHGEQLQVHFYIPDNGRGDANV